MANDPNQVLAGKPGPGFMVKLADKGRRPRAAGRKKKPARHAGKKSFSKGVPSR